MFRSCSGPVIALVAGIIAIVVPGTGLSVEAGQPEHGTEFPALLIVQVPVGSSEGTDGCADGARIVRVAEVDGQPVEQVLTSGFLSACDPAVAFDGRHILFAGKREATESFGIWRMREDGSEVDRVIGGTSDSFAPLYVGSLFQLNDDHPTDRFVYLSTENGWADEISGRPLAALYSADLDGGNRWRISYDLCSARNPSVLANGRILFSRSRRDGTEGSFDALMAVNNDGTDLMVYSGAHDGAPYKAMPRPGFDGKTYFIEGGAPGPLGGGTLAAVSQRRPLHSHLVFPSVAGSSRHSPLPLQDGRLLVSCLDRGRDEAGYQLYWMDPETGRRLGKVYGAEGYHSIDTQELAPHPRVKGRSSVVDMAKETGVFFCISSHITDRPEYRRLGPGTVKSVRVFEGVPRRPGGASARETPSQRLLGVVPVERDGSFHIEVPAQTPMVFELLDGAGAVVAGQRSWTWVMPREWRGCVGCHEDREMVVPNVLAEAVVKPAVSLARGELK